MHITRPNLDIRQHWNKCDTAVRLRPHASPVELDRVLLGPALLPNGRGGTMVMVSLTP